MLFESAIGDAYGFGFEYADENLPLNDLSRYVRHPTYGASLRPGQYTDDTQMSIAIAEALVEGIPWTKLALARKFVEVFKRDPREGYAKGFQKILEESKTGVDLLSKLDPNSDKSGAAMRAGPLGHVQDTQSLIAMAEIQASITHDTPDGRAAAVAAALMTHYFLYEDSPKSRLGLYLNSHLEGRDWNEPWVGRVKARGWMSVRGAVTAIRTYDSLSSILRACVAYSGDTDTVSAIALSAASCCPAIIQDLPLVLIEGLEGAPYGGPYLKQLDQRLLDV